jgi:hypothetical protein
MPALSKEVPAPIVAARAKLEELGLDITKENLEKHVSPADINKMMGSLRTALGRPGNEKQKNNFANAVDKRACLAAYMLDPHVSSCSMLNTHSKEVVSGTQTRKMWLTIAQMSSPTMYNSLDDAKLIAQDCPERDHEKPSMAAAGKKQYEVEVSEEVYNNLNKDKTELSSSASVNADDYKSIKASMDEPASKRKKVVIKHEPSEDELAKKAADEQRRKVVAAHTLALTSLKKSAERGRKNYNDALEKANTISTKGYPKEMVVHFSNQLRPLHSAHTKAMDFWTVCCKMDLAAKEENAIDELRGELESAQAEMEDVQKTIDPVRKEIFRIAK